MSHEQSKFQPPEKGHEKHQLKENPTAGAPITDKTDNSKQYLVKRQDAFRSFKLTGEGQTSFTLVSDSQEIRDTRPLRSSDRGKSSQADDGTYTVNFPGHQPAVNVRGLTTGEKMIGSSSEGNIVVSLIEKAYGQVLNEAHDPKFAIAAEATKLGLNRFSQALEFLTGDKVDEVLTAKRGNFGANENDFINEIQSAQRQHRVVFAGTVGDIPGPAVRRLGIHKGHAYEITYDPAPDSPSTEIPMAYCTLSQKAFQPRLMDNQSNRSNQV
jgi:hypothetical protein